MSSHTFLPLRSQAWQPLNWSVSVDWPVLDTLLMGSRHKPYLAFRVWFLPLSVMFLSFIQVVACTGLHSCLCPRPVPAYGYHILFVHSTFGRWGCFHSGHCEQCCCEMLISFQWVGPILLHFRVVFTNSDPNVTLRGSGDAPPNVLETKLVHVHLARK